MSKFSGLIKAVQEEKKPAEAENPAPEAKAGKSARPKLEKGRGGPAASSKNRGASRSQATSKAVATPSRPRKAEPLPSRIPAKTRRVGRSADPDYSKSTMYIHQEVHQDVKRALIGTGRDYSELVEDLLRDWLKQNT